MSYAEHYDIIEALRVTEKSSRVAANGQYVFKVRKDATKKSISQAIEKIYDVKVKACNVVNRPGKYRARRNGQTKSFRIAYVTLESGQELNMAE